MFESSLTKDVFTISPFIFHPVQDRGSILDANPPVLGNDVDQLAIDLLGHADLPTNVDPALPEDDVSKDLLAILANLILDVLLGLALHP